MVIVNQDGETGHYYKSNRDILYTNKDHWIFLNNPVKHETAILGHYRDSEEVDFLFWRIRYCESVGDAIFQMPNEERLSDILYTLLRITRVKYLSDELEKMTRFEVGLDE